MPVIIVYNNGSTSLALPTKERLLKHVVVSETLSKNVDKTNHPVLLKDKKKLKMKNYKKNK